MSGRNVDLGSGGFFLTSPAAWPVSSRLFLAPVRFAAGIAIKIPDATAAGLATP